VSDISRADRIIGAVVFGVLLALLGVGLAQRATGTHSSTPTGTRQAVAPTGAGATAGAPSGDATDGPVSGTVTAVGDSVLLDAVPYLQADLPGVHVTGQVNLQFDDGVQMVAADRAAGTLGDVLVVALGTNGAVTMSQFDAMMQAANGVKRVVLVNVNVPRTWATSVNAVLASGVAGHRGTAVLANWNALSAGHPTWFAPDQVHLEPAGAKAFADLVAHYA
jgi:hypothetical protein